MKIPRTQDSVFGAVLTGLIEDASTNDKNWFKQHPGETRFFREYRPGEFPDAVTEGVANDVARLRSQAPNGARVRIVVEVTRCRPGLRTRRPHVIAWTDGVEQ